MSQNKKLWIIDYDSLLKKFMEGLLKIAKSRLDMVIESKAGTNKLDIILELLKQKK